MCEPYLDADSLNASVQEETFQEYLKKICFDHHVGSSKIIAEKHPRHQFSFFFMGLGGTLLCFIGLLVNLLSLVHLHSYKPRIGEKVIYIAALVVWDCLLLTNGWMSLSLSVLIGKGQLKTSGVFVRTYNFTQAFMHVALTGVVWTTVLLTIERYVTVTRPLWERKGRTKRAYRLVVAAAVAAFAFNVPRFFEVQKSVCCDMHLNIPITEVKRADFALPGTPYFTYYRLMGKAMLIALIPFLILTTLTYLIVRKVKKWDQMFGGRDSVCSTSMLEVGGRRQSRMPHVKFQRQLSRVLSFALVKFLVCHSPCVVCDIAEFVLFRNTETDDNHWFFSYLIDGGNFLVLLHSASTGAFLLAFSRRTFAKKRHELVSRYQSQPSKQDENDECEEIC